MSAAETYERVENIGNCHVYRIHGGRYAGCYQMMFRQKRKRGRRIFVFWCVP